MIQSKYTGFFPGQTKLGVSERVQMTVRKCLEPVVEILLAAPMFRKVKEDRIPRRLRDVPPIQRQMEKRTSDLLHQWSHRLIQTVWIMHPTLTTPTCQPIHECYTMPLVDPKKFLLP